MRRALILAGTGAIGWAIVRRLAAAGWDVVVTGRSPELVPVGLAGLGARFVRADRRDRRTLGAVVGSGADLLVDCACFTRADASALVEVLGDVSSPVMISSKAVYADDQGRHSNSDDSPRFEHPVREDQRTLPPSDGDYDSARAYGGNKVAAERVLLDSGDPVTVLRPSKVHGAWSRRPREWVFVKRARPKERRPSRPAGMRCRPPQRRTQHRRARGARRRQTRPADSQRRRPRLPGRTQDRVDRGVASRARLGGAAARRK
jgi:nucleoside-diphosphate-sugar epimerase